MRIPVLWTLFFPRDSVYNSSSHERVHERVFLCFVSLDLSVVCAIRLHGLNCNLFLFPDKPILLKKYLVVYLFNVNRVTYQWTEYLNWKEDLYRNDWNILIWVKFTYFFLISAKRDICQSGVVTSWPCHMMLWRWCHINSKGIWMPQCWPFVPD